MIHRLTLRNFKSIGEQTYDFTPFDLLVGRNNSGKSTVLQALAIWQFCVDTIYRAGRQKSKGVQVILPNFTALPVPEFNLLWRDKILRQSSHIGGKAKQENVLISIEVEWRLPSGFANSFGVELRYQSPQTIYAVPIGGWPEWYHCQRPDFPRVAYVPPFSGLEPTERWLDTGPLRQHIGKGQPGSVLRNLLLRVSTAGDDENSVGPHREGSPEANWNELAGAVKEWFGVDLLPPSYRTGEDLHIEVNYIHNGKEYDIISAGSGVHQALTVLAFLYGYPNSTILLDEPDAHLHVNLQREILAYFRRKAVERHTQFIIATHAEEFVQRVDVTQILSLLAHEQPRRVPASAPVLAAMALVTNQDLVELSASPFLVYVEGSSDERILRAWSNACGAGDAVAKVTFRPMHGGSKKEMRDRADAHFAAVRQVLPNAKHIMLFDFDADEKAFHPPSDNPVVAEWRRKNIENYLLVPDVWVRAALSALADQVGPVVASPVESVIAAFFAAQSLTLPPGKTWRTVAAEAFGAVDGKRLLFESADSLFHQLRNGSPSVQVLREHVAFEMRPDEIHEDVYQFMSKLKAMTSTR